MVPHLDAVCRGSTFDLRLLFWMEVFSFPSSFSEPLGLPPCRIPVAVIAELKSLPPHPPVVTVLRYAVPDLRALPVELCCGLRLVSADTSLSRGVAYRRLMVYSPK